MRERLLWLFASLVFVAVGWAAVAHVTGWTWLEVAGVWVFLRTLHAPLRGGPPKQAEAEKKQVDAFDRARW